MRTDTISAPAYRPDKVLQARLELGLTQKQLAKKLGVTEHTIANWETGRVGRIRWPNLFELCRLAGKPPEWFAVHVIWGVARRQR